MKRRYYLIFLPIPLLLWLTAGNLYRAVSAATLTGGSGGNAHFLGYYWISAAYFGAVLLNLALGVGTVMFFRKRSAKRKTSAEIGKNS